MKKNFYKLAFTLAETLIVMGIIGVVAALTLPNLNSSTGNKEKVAKVKKIYQNLDDAFGRAQAVYGPYNEWFVNDATDEARTKRAGERITEFMKTSKVCGTEKNKGCMPKAVKGLDGKGLTGGNDYTNLDNDSIYYKVILADGTAIAIYSELIWLSEITVDIDGPNKGPSTLGIDVFEFDIDAENNVLYTHCNEDRLIENLQKGYCTSYWIMRYDNMDYLKVDSNGKCPDGKTILDGVSNTTCK